MSRKMVNVGVQSNTICKNNLSNLPYNVAMYQISCYNRLIAAKTVIHFNQPANRRNLMAKKQFQSNPIMEVIFNDLDKYREFCVDYGYKFDEATLGDMRNFVYRQHTRQLQGKEAKYNWVEPVAKIRY